VTEVYRIAGRQ